MKYCTLFFLLLAACHFHPLYQPKQMAEVCVSDIPDKLGYDLKHQLKVYFPETKNCRYTLSVQTPLVAFSDQSISNKDFVTVQRITAKAHFSLLDAKKKKLLSNAVYTDGSSAVVQNPYSTIVSTQKTTQNLLPLLAEQIALQVTAFLDQDNK